MSQRCLLIIDMLNDFLDMWPEAEAARLVQNTNRLVAAFRERGLPIIWVRQEFRADLSDAFLEMQDKSIAKTIENTPGAALHPELDWQAGDRVVVKKRYSAFFGTNLDALLEDLGAHEQADGQDPLPFVEGDERGFFVCVVAGAVGVGVGVSRRRRC